MFKFLNYKDLVIIRDIASEMLISTNRGKDSEKDYITKCWLHGLEYALKKAGYKVCISKDGKTVYSD